MATFTGDASGLRRVNFLLLGAFLAILILFGGASRADALSQPIVRIAAIVAGAAALLQISSQQWRSVRTPFLSLATVGLVIVVQLVPIPFGLWSDLPGRGHFAEMLAVAGVPEAWRPLTMTPDLAWNSALAILAPLAFVLGLSVAGPQALRALLPLLLAGIGLHSVIGLIQVAGGTPYFYRVTNLDSAVGLFANRNHLAVFVALILPLSGLWALLPHPDPAYRRLRFWMALCIAAAAIPFLIMIGSRAGLLVGGLGAIAVFPLILTQPSEPRRATREKRLWMIAFIPALIALVAVIAARASGRDLALQRLFEADTGLRADHLPIYFRMIGDFFPFGSGFGSFDSIFRGYEPQASLNASYLNHAHNDLVQIVIEGGLPALLLAAAFAIWFALTAIRLWVSRVRSSADLYGRVGSIVVLQLIVASAVDYPLRTPLLGVVFIIACFWMLRFESSDKSSGGAEGRVGTGKAFD